MLHDTLLAFATLTPEDMDKQIRLQFNGEVSFWQPLYHSPEWTRAACLGSG